MAAPDLSYCALSFIHTLSAPLRAALKSALIALQLQIDFLIQSVQVVLLELDIASNAINVLLTPLTTLSNTVAGVLDVIPLKDSLECVMVAELGSNYIDTATSALRKFEGLKFDLMRYTSMKKYYRDYLAELEDRKDFLQAFIDRL